MSDAMSRPKSLEHIPFDDTTAGASAAPSHPYGLVLDTDGRILLVDRTEELLDRQFSQVTTETFDAATAMARHRLPVDRNRSRRDVHRGA
ncbi:hypothetical protein ACFQ9R_11445 [Nocardia sp. NPDC056541]|uniref:hypothetical protein n=1 Tax=unclassified Nocardia TaxID=2637762 RepID=UPI00366FB7DC